MTIEEAKMELNKEEIIKALECWSNTLCENAPCKTNGYVHSKIICDICVINTVKNAISLIKELTEENAKIGIENFNLVCELSRIKEDTVRKMQERLRDRHLTATNPNVICLYETELDQIAKEMLEGL